ncbi:MAG TPA: uridine diphosphate-N-acetylglucosamine-binding protein YvcK [Actinomycetes bacterium]|nr:uridine diphosphate-N-acetylglucosamine-binding protein YvcK [Actinomycetes bacterium]
MVALGGGHGLAASLQALRRVTDALTAVVTVADDGGSSGRLRRELGVLPPGDLRMALAALCGDDEWGQTWSRVAQHRFRSAGDLHDHAVGNLLIVALWELLGDSVAGLDWVARLLGAHGRVLPMSLVPLDIEAVMALEPGAEGPGRSGQTVTVRGQVAVATTPGHVVSLGLVPDRPPACQEAVAAVRSADWVVLGPGSWYTSVIPHLLVPDLAEALCSTSARRVVVLNLAPQPGETAGFAPETHLEVLAEHAGGLRLDAVVADRAAVPHPDRLARVAESLGAELRLDHLARDGHPEMHDPDRLGAVLGALFADPGVTAGDSRPGRPGRFPRLDPLSTDRM